MTTKPQNENKEGMDAVKKTNLKTAISKTSAFAEKVKVNEVIGSGVCESAIRNLEQYRQALSLLKARLLSSMARQVTNTFAR